MAGLGVCRRFSPAVGVDCLARRARVIGRINVGILFLLALGFARLRVDGGLPINGVPQIMGYIFFVALGTGPGLFAEQTYVAFALLAVLGFTCIGLWPALQFEGLKLAEVTGISSRQMVLGMCVGLATGLASGYLFSLETIYEHGLFALQEQGGARSEARIGRYYNYLFKDAGATVGPTDWVRLGFHGIGAAVTAFLSVMRQHFLRWPFHPMGYVLVRALVGWCGGLCWSGGCASGWRFATVVRRPIEGFCPSFWG